MKGKAKVHWVSYPEEKDFIFFKQIVLLVIAKYRKSLSVFNCYGHQRAMQLKEKIDREGTNAYALEMLVAAFIKTGKTEIDSHFFSFFRSPSRCSDWASDSSLRGRMIKLFVYRDKPPPYHDRWLYYVKRREMVQSDVNAIRDKIFIPVPVEENAESAFESKQSPGR